MEDNEPLSPGSSYMPRYWPKLIKELVSKGSQTQNQLKISLGLPEQELTAELEKLSAHGVPIILREGRYELAGPCCLLDPQKLDLLAQDPIEKVYVFETVSSTNTFLQDKNEGNSLICISETQTKGHGRFGRKWESPFGSQVIYSLLYQFDPGQDLTCLGLVVSLSVAQSLEHFFQKKGDFKVKWPNDIFLNKHKIGGVLVEFSHRKTVFQGAVMGVGLNINRAFSKRLGSHEDFMTCEDFYSTYTDRNLFCTFMSRRLLKDLKFFKENGFEAFRKDWSYYDFLFDQTVTVQVSQKVQRGVSKGIDEKGNLIVEREGRKYHFGAGEVSLGSQKVTKEKY